MKNKTIVVTGATSGIGYETLKVLVKAGHHVIGIGRSKERCARCMTEIKSFDPHSLVEYVVADLASLKQVREVAQQIKDLLNENAIDCLINNAGTFASYYIPTHEGFELQWTVNYLAVVLLTHELLPNLEKSSDGRVITVSSGSHYGTKIHFKDVLFHKHYRPLLAYKQSKLAGVMFSNELNKRLKTIQAFVSDPGLVNTEIGLKGTQGIVKWVWSHRKKHGTSIEEGAKTSIFLATTPKEAIQDALYFKDCQSKKPNRYILHEQASINLWNLTMKMCGIQFDMNLYK